MLSCMLYANECVPWHVDELFRKRVVSNGMGRAIGNKIRLLVGVWRRS